MQNEAEVTALSKHPRTLVRRAIALRAVVVLVCFIVGFGTVRTAFSRERGPRVDISCPATPIVVNLYDRQALAYELHITNFDMVPLTLKRLDVFTAGDTQPVKSITGDALSGMLWAVGTPMHAKGSPATAPGNRTVVFLWIELPAKTAPPTLLRHRLVFTTGDSGGQSLSAETESTLQDFSVPVNRDAAPALSPPFEGGVWLAGEGPGNDSSHRRTSIAIDGHIYSPERFAIDWVKVGPNGDSNHDGTARNENWWGYGEPIHAVADGEVTQVVDGIEENTPRVLPKQVTLDNIAGNYVIMRISPNRYVAYAHLQRGSISVRPLERIARGTVIGRLGNSGQATGPHLHFQVTDRDSILESEGVPFIFPSFQYFGPGSKFEMTRHRSIRWVQSIPENNAVIQFDRLEAR